MSKLFIKINILLAMALVPACKDSDFKGRAKNVPPTVTKEFTQDEYPINEKIYVQGNRGEISAEDFNQGEWGKLDLLVVVDNSGSMAEEQGNLATKLEPLLAHVEKSEWQIAVTTTDSADGCRQALIKKSDPNPKQAFANAIRQGTGGDGVERGIDQAVRGLQSNCLFTSKWIRDESTVAVLIISDEDNCQIDSQRGYGCNGEPGRNGEHLTDYLATIRKVGETARVYGLIWHPSETQAQCSTGLGVGTEYAKVIDASKGKWGSICDADYSKTLLAISEDVSKILKLEHELAEMPVDDSLKVLVDGELFDKFEVDGRTVKFKEPPPFGSKVEFAYRYGKEGEIRSEFEVTKPIAGEPVAVEVNGKEVADFEWKEDGTKVVFSESPEDKAEIKIRYKEKTKLKSEFDIGTELVPNSVQAWIDDAKTKAFTFDKNSGKVVFDPVPPEGSKIKITFIKKLKL